MDNRPEVSVLSATYTSYVSPEVDALLDRIEDSEIRYTDQELKAIAMQCLRAIIRNHNARNRLGGTEYLVSYGRITEDHGTLVLANRDDLRTVECGTAVSIRNIVI